MLTALTKPRLVPDLVFIPVENGVLIDGLDRPHVIRGILAQTILPSILQLIDGQHSVEDLILALPDIPEKDIHGALNLLTEWHLIDGTSNSLADETPNALSLFLARAMLNTGRSDELQNVYQQLRDFIVLIVATPSCITYAHNLKEVLTKTGIAAVDVVDVNVFQPQSCSLVVALTAFGEDESLFRRLEDQTVPKRIAWLRASIGVETADIGPFFGANVETCFRCFCHTQASETTQTFGGRPSPEVGIVWADFVALEIISSVVRLEHAIEGRKFRRFHLPDFSSELLQYSRLKFCGASPIHSLLSTHEMASGKVNDVPDCQTALVYEDYIGAEYRPVTSVASHEQVMAMSIRLFRESKEFPNSKKIKFDQISANLKQPVLKSFDHGGLLQSRLDKRSLGLLLALTSGIQDDPVGQGVKRWAPTAGNLGSPELFVLARSVDQMEEGLYFYESHRHTLALYRKRNRVTITELMIRILGGDESHLPDALVVFTGAFHRLRKKYGMFGYRLLYLDAGVALSQMQSVARALRIRSRILPQMPDDLLERELTLRSFDEQSTTCLELFGSGARGRVKDRNGYPARQIHVAGSHPADYFAAASIDMVTETLFRESRTTESELATFPPPHPVFPTDPIALNHSLSVLLPKPACDGSSLGEVLLHRRSIRSFGDGAVPLCATATALYYAARSDMEDWPSDHQAGIMLHFFVLAVKVEGLAAGIYQYDVHRHTLNTVRQGLHISNLTCLLTQDEFVNAPSIIWIAGNMDRASILAGSLGHRRMLLRAGAAGHKLSMALMAQGLVGTLLGGLIPGAARELFGLDGFSKASLFAFAFGRRYS